MPTETRFSHLHLPPSQKQFLWVPANLFLVVVQVECVPPLWSHSRKLIFRFSDEAVGFPDPAPKTQKQVTFPSMGV